MTASLHPSLEHLEFLVGEWHGLGVVGYPTITESRYEQEISFSHDGRPFLAYISKTWLIDDDGARVRPARDAAKRSSEQSPADDHLLDLSGPATDRRQLGVA